MKYALTFSLLLVGCGGCVRPMIVARPPNAPPSKAIIIGKSKHKYSASTLAEAIHKCVSKEEVCRLVYVK